MPSGLRMAHTRALATPSLPAKSCPHGQCVSNTAAAFARSASIRARGGLHLLSVSNSGRFPPRRYAVRRPVHADEVRLGKMIAAGANAGALRTFSRRSDPGTQRRRRAAHRAGPRRDLTIRTTIISKGPSIFTQKPGEMAGGRAISRIGQIGGVGIDSALPRHST